jgi:hypothetical protein
MAHTPGESRIEQAYELLRTCGPATAYDFMQEAGDLQEFPPSLLTQINMELQALYRRRRPGSRPDNVDAVTG